MQLTRFEVPGLAHYSYLIESGKNAVVVDPRRDTDIYLEHAAAHGLHITHVLETHIHADFASGALALARSAGAELWLSAHDCGESYQYAFDHISFHDGQELRVGDIRIAALHTPGHTPEHVSFLLYDESRGNYPAALLSGDFVFIGSFGRPDLLGEGSKHQLANMLFESVHDRLRPLPDGTEIYPAHGAGSMCGAGMAERPQSTLGYERACNPWFSEQDRTTFVQHVLTDVPPFPSYYRRMKRVNSDGPPVVDVSVGPKLLSAEEFGGASDRDDAIVIDLRTPEAFGGAHIPGSLSIGAGPLLSVWAAWVVPYDRPILLVGDSTSDYERALRSLVRVGLDNVCGCLNGGIQSWIASGYELAGIPQVSINEAYDRLSRGAYLLDVRGESEWQQGHAPGAHHVFAGYLPSRMGEIPSGIPILATCAGGYRASVAASLLKRLGFKDVSNVIGGMNAWIQRGLPVSVQDTSDFSRTAAPSSA